MELIEIPNLGCWMVGLQCLTEAMKLSFASSLPLKLIYLPDSLDEACAASSFDLAGGGNSSTGVTNGSCVAILCSISC